MVAGQERERGDGYRAVKLPHPVMSMVLRGDIYVLSRLVSLRCPLEIRGLNGPLYSVL